MTNDMTCMKINYENFRELIKKWEINRPDEEKT